MGVAAIGTTRRPPKAAEGLVFLDLEDPGKDEAWRRVRPDVVLLCAGVATLEACRRDPDRSRRINVEGTVAVARDLAADGASVIHLSSNHVFDGTRPRRAASDAPCPVTEYGRQKAETEAALRACVARLTVVRLTKVVSGGRRDPVFAQWVRDLKAGGEIHPFCDMALSPVPLACVVTILIMLALAPREGVFQISGEEDWSYDRAAGLAAAIVGAAPGLVRPIRAVESGRFFERVAPHTTLDTSAIEEVFGVRPPAVRRTLERTFTDLAGAPGEERP